MGRDAISDNEIVNGIQAIGLLVIGLAAASALAPVCPPVSAAIGQVLPIGVSQVASKGIGSLLG